MNKDILIKICQVISISDDADGERIKVRLSPEDDRRTVDEIPYAHPLLPKMLHVKPRVGEGVLVLLTEVGNGHSNRYYIGPIISQPQYMDRDIFGANSLSLYSGALKAPENALSTNIESIGSFGNDEDIAIYGRKKNDIILTNEDVKIRCGSRVKQNGKIVFNRTDPAFILLRHSDDAKVDNYSSKNKTYRSNATIVADKINILSNVSSPFKTNDREKLITDEEMQKIISEAHQLPYGDLLVNFLTKFVKVFATHTHPYPGDPPCKPEDFNEVINYDLNTILNENIRIN